MSARESCGVCGGLEEAGDLRTCVECGVRFCRFCESEDQDLCVDCGEEEQEEEDN